MFEYDYSFCSDKGCPYKDCMRHGSRMPVGVPVSVSGLGYYRDKEEGLCDYYEQAEGAVQHNLNVVTEDELVELGLSRIKAARIVVARDQRGGFRSVSDLLKVRSIGKTTYEKLRDKLYVLEKPRDDSPALDARQREWMLRLSDATEWMCEFLNKTFGKTWCKLRFEHVDAAAYWFTFELVNDSRRQTWSVRHSDLEG